MTEDRADPDFDFTVAHDFVRACQTPIMVLPDDVPAHPYAGAVGSARLAPKGQMSFCSWKDPKDLIPLAARHVGRFLRAIDPLPT